MLWIILTVFFGFLGVYRFKKKDYKQGIIYIFTAGLFIFGWIHDVQCAVREYNQIQHKKIEEENVGAPEEIIKFKKDKASKRSSLCVLLSVIILIVSPWIGGIIVGGEVEDDGGGYTTSSYISCKMCGNSYGSRKLNGYCAKCYNDIRDIMRR